MFHFKIGNMKKHFSLYAGAEAGFAFNYKENPTDNSPMGSAAELNILKVFSAMIGIVISK